jgi:hypothetical protein
MTYLIATASYEAAKYAVTNWHYSKCLPTGKLVKYGVWENDKFIGVIIFSRGASPHLGTALNLDQTEVCELTRIALNKHNAPVSQFLAAALKKLRQEQEGLKLVVSFADPKEGHVGGIYKATNWIYTGKSNEVTEYFIGNRWRHKKSVYYHPERLTAPKRISPGKFRYLFPLNRAIKKQALALALDYPLAVEGSTVSRISSANEV